MAKEYATLLDELNDLSDRFIPFGRVPVDITNIKEFEFTLYGLSEHRQISKAFDGAKSRFDVFDRPWSSV